MRKSLALSVAFAFALAMAVAAQSTSQGSTTSRQDHPSKSSKSVTVTGCLQSGSTANSYVLTNVSGSNLTSGTSGQEDMPTSGQSNMTITLSPASSKVNLKSHVGHKIEVTGTMVPSSDKTSRNSGYGSGQSGQAGTSGQSGMSGQSGTSGQSGPSTSDIGHKMKVQSVRMLSDSCTEK